MSERDLIGRVMRYVARQAANRISTMLERPLERLKAIYIGQHYRKRFFRERRAVRRLLPDGELRTLETQPLISVLMPVYNTRPGHLKAAIRSVQRQIYPNWELVCVDDASPRSSIRRLLRRIERRDHRVRVIRNDKNVGISKATSVAFDHSRGDWIAHMDHDDVLREDALLQIARVANTSPETEFIYTDEVYLGKHWWFRYHYANKADFNLSKLLALNYICHFMVLRRELVERIGGYREGYDGSQDHELALRASLSAARITHISEAVYFWRQHGQNFSAEKADVCRESSLRAVKEQTVARWGIPCEVYPGRLPFSYHVRRDVMGSPTVSVIIPYRDQAKLLLNCVNSLCSVTSDSHLEIILVDNGSVQAETKQVSRWLAERYGSVRLLEYDGVFNFSAINNWAAGEASGSHLLLLNNDTYFFRGDWLYELLQHSQLPDVGAVGPMLLFPDNTIQHAGVVLGLGGLAGHIGLGMPYHAPRWMGRLILEHDVTCLTGAALMVKKTVWEEVGGMDEAFPVAYNDVDLCIRIRMAGYRNVYNPYSMVYHLESRSRGSEQSIENEFRFREDKVRMFRKWGRDVLTRDEYYSPHLTRLASEMLPKRRGEDEAYDGIVTKMMSPYSSVCNY